MEQRSNTHFVRVADDDQNGSERETKIKFSSLLVALSVVSVICAAAFGYFTAFGFKAESANLGGVNLEVTTQVYRELFRSMGGSQKSLVLNATTLKYDAITEFFQSTVKADSITIVGCEMTNSNTISINGTTSVLGMDNLFVQGTLFYSIANIPMLRLYLTKVDSQDSPITIFSVLGSDQVDPIYQTISLINSTLVLSTFDDSEDSLKVLHSSSLNTLSQSNTTSIEKGLSIVATANLTSESRLSQLVQFIEKEVAQLWGKLAPTFEVSIHIPDVKIGNTLKFVNSTVQLEKKEPVFNLTSHLVITPPNVSPLQFFTQGTFDLTNSQLGFSGNLENSWTFPAIEEDDRLKLASASVSIVISTAKNVSAVDRIVDGAVSAGFSYGDLSLSMGLKYPAADKVSQLAFELIFNEQSSSTSVLSLPIIDVSFPRVQSSKTSIVLSPFTGSYCFVSPNPPTTNCVNVVSGFNLYSSIDFASSASALSLPDQSTTQNAELVLEGTYSKLTGISFEMEVPNQIVLIDNSIVLNNAVFTFKDTFVNSQKIVSTEFKADLTFDYSSSSNVELKVDATVKSPKISIVSIIDVNSPTITLPIVDKGVTDLKLLSVDFEYDNSVKVVDVQIGGQGDIAGINVSAKLHAVYAFGSTDVNCWDASIQVNQDTSITKLSEGILGRAAVSDPTTGIANMMTQEMQAVFNSSMSNIQFDAQLFCHEASLSFDLSDKIFGDVFIALNYSRFIAANDMADLLNIESKSTTGALSQNQAQAQLISDAFSTVSVLIRDPFPSFSVCDYYNPLNTLIKVMDPSSITPALQNASVAIQAILSQSNICSEKIQSQDALTDLNNKRTGELSFVMLPIKGWSYNSSWTIGGGNDNGITPSTFPLLSVYRAFFTVSTSEILLAENITMKTSDMNPSTQVALLRPIKIGLTFTFTLFPSHPQDFFSRGIHWLFPDVNEIVISGEMRSHDWKLSGVIPDGVVHLGSDFTISNQSIVVQSQQPHLSVDSHIQIGDSSKIGSDKNVFDASGVFETETQFQLSAKSIGTWSFEIGKTQLTMTNLEFLLNLAGNSTQGITYELKVLGETTYGSAVFDGSLYSSSKDPLKIDASLRDEPAIKLGDFIVSACKDVETFDKVAQTVDPIFNTVAFAGAKLSVDVGTEHISFSGNVLVFDGESDFELLVQKAEATDHSVVYNWIVGLAWKSNKKFSDFAPSITSLDSFQFGPPALVVSSYDTQISFSFPDLTNSSTQAAYNVKHGLNFFASLQAQDGGALDWISKWTGITEFVANVYIESFEEFEIHAEMEGGLKVLPLTKLTEMGLVVVVKPTEFEAGIDGTVLVEPSAGGPLSLYGRIMAGDIAASAKFASLGPWENVCGVTGLEIDQSDLEAEISYALVPLSFGIGGGIHYGKIGGDLDFLVDLTTESNYAVKAELDDFVLADLISACCGSFLDVSTHAEVLLETGVERSILYQNPSLNTLNFNGQVFPPGLKVAIDQLLILGWINATGDVAIDESNGISIAGSVQPFTFFDILQVGGYSPNGPETTPASLSVEIVKSKLPSFKINAAIRLFTVIMGTLVEFSDQGITLDVAFGSDLFNFTLDCSSVGPLTHPTDFSVAGTINNQVLDYLNKTLPTYLDNAKSEFDQKFGDAVQSLESARANLASLQQQIDTIRQRDAALQTDAEKALTNAQMSVQSAKNQVDSLGSRISDLESEIRGLKWYQEWKAVPLGAEIAGLYIAKEAADGALDLAIDALKLAEAAVDHAQVLDPELDALVVSYGIANASITALEATLLGINKVLDNIATFDEKVIKGLAILFNPELISVSGSLADIKKLSLAHITVVGWFLGDHVSFDLNIDLSLGEHLVSAIWSWIAHRFGDDGQLSYAEFRIQPKV
eukprot:c20682_g1_i1.p1 GENE.c20682_g1_i1~~c20682_g1_i1.p1  ORF type:complete len:1880 (+),score=814.44 c20682_g1_i1:2-5641(+)